MMNRADPAMSPSDFKCLVRRFYSLQTERMEAYTLLKSHEAYLRTGPDYDFEHYRQLVHEMTKAFCGISKEVLEIKERLHQDFNRPDLSEHIEKLQIKEKQKLQLTAKLQLAKQSAQDHPEDQSYQEKVQEIKQDTLRVCCEIFITHMDCSFHELSTCIFSNKLIIKNKESLCEIMQDFKYDSEDAD